MLKSLIFSGFACCASGVQAETWPDAVKESIDATWHPPHVAGIGDPVMPLAASGAGDLSPDPSFGTGGQATYYLDYGSNLEGWGLRVVAIPGGAGWYVLAKHGAGNGTWDAVVVKVLPGGTAETTYKIPTPMFRLDDATIDAASGKFYFAGGAKQAGFADSDFAVTCVDITVGANGGTCAGFGSSGGGTAYVPFDRPSSSKDDVARRVLVRPNLGVLLGGWAKDGADRYVFAAAALYRDNGGLVTRFGSGGEFTTDLGSPVANLDVNVFDMALSNDPDTEARLYIAGNFSRNTARKDYDGVVLALNAWTGTFDTSFNGGGFKAVYLDLGDPVVNLSDAVTAIAVQANGQLALAGWSMDTYLNNRFMLARLNTNGTSDSGFCSGQGTCAADGGSASGLPSYFWPTAIAERPNNRELVIAMEYRPGGTDAGADQVRQVAIQTTANASAARASMVADYSANSGQTPYSVTTGMLVTADSVMIAGTRRWLASSNDYDGTLVRTLANDTIYADTFGGTRSD